MVQAAVQQPMGGDAFSHVGRLFQQAQQSPFGRQVVGVIEQVKGRLGQQEGGNTKRRFRSSSPRIIVPPRDHRFAAILPGDSIAEQVREMLGGADNAFWLPVATWHGPSYPHTDCQSSIAHT